MTQKNEISVRKIKAKMKVVKNSPPPTVFVLTPKNRQYIDGYKNSTRASYAVLINRAIDAARDADVLKNIDIPEPKSVAKARALLEKWNTQRGPRRRAKAANDE